MSQNQSAHSSTLIKHIKKKIKQDSESHQMLNSRSTSSRQANSPATLEPRRDLPLHKIPELLAKITGTLSSTLTSSDIRHLPSTNDRCEQLFKHYADKNECISVDGMLRFCNDLSVEPDSYEVLLFCFLCQAKQMYMLTKNEFILGMKTFANSIDNLNDLRTLLLNYNILPYEKEFYLWTYHYGLIDGQNRLTRQNAISLWRLFYLKHVKKPQILDLWLAYLDDDINNEIPKTISFDTWKIFPQFAEFIEVNGYESYDDNEAWPYLFDVSLPRLKTSELKKFDFATSQKNQGTQRSNNDDITPIARPNSTSSSLFLRHNGVLRLSETQTYKFTVNDLTDQSAIGVGNFGTVNKMMHQPSQTVMAVKRIRSDVDENHQKQMLQELDIVMRENKCPYIVQFYGALFKEASIQHRVDCWICMELMNTSLDHFYKFVYHKLHQSIPESILVFITHAALQALDYIKTCWSIIHRDVKPSNILVSRTTVKLCDFGISGKLIDSIAQTRDVGCRPYLPPERLDPQLARKEGYGIQSDVWSLGITLYEITTGHFPFREWASVFDQLQQIVEGSTIELKLDRLSDNCKSFINSCLIKKEDQRPNYKHLLQHAFLERARQLENSENVPAYLSHIIDGLEHNTDKFQLYYFLPSGAH